MRVGDSQAHGLVFSGVFLRRWLWHLGNPENTCQLRLRLSVEAPVRGNLVTKQERAGKVSLGGIVFCSRRGGMDG